MNGMNMERPSYYECNCGFYHVVGQPPACDDEASCFIEDELDERHGSKGWDEVFSEEANVAEPAPVVRRANYDRIMALTGDKDLDGNLIEIGCRVRCFSAYYDMENDWLVGLDTVGRCSYSEGKIIAINELQFPPHEHPIPYYIIEMESMVSPSRHGKDSERLPFKGEIPIPVNGTLVRGIRIDASGTFHRDLNALDWKTFGVLRLATVKS